MKENYIEAVKEFHMLFDLPIVNDFQIPSIDRCQLRIDLIQEELNELQEAVNENNKTEVADALTDLQYVLTGAIIEFGLQGKIQELFNEVHRSNMSKPCSTEKEAQETIDYYLNERGIESYMLKKKGKFFVYSKADKALKSINYSGADINSVLYKK